MNRTAPIVLLTVLLLGALPAVCHAEGDAAFIEELRRLGLNDLAGQAARDALASKVLPEDQRLGVELQSLLVERDAVLARSDAAQIAPLLLRLDRFGQAHVDRTEGQTAILETVRLRWNLARLMMRDDLQAAERARWIMHRALDDAQDTGILLARALEAQRRLYTKQFHETKRLRRLGKAYALQVARLNVLGIDLRRRRGRAAQADYLTASTQLHLAQLYPAGGEPYKDHLVEAADTYDRFYRRYRTTLGEAFLARTAQVDCLLLLGDLTAAKQLAESTLEGDLHKARALNNPALKRTLQKARASLIARLARIENLSGHPAKAAALAAAGLARFGDRPMLRLEEQIALMMQGEGAAGTEAVARMARASGSLAGRALDALSALPPDRMVGLPAADRVRIARRLFSQGRDADVLTLLKAGLPETGAATLEAHALLAEALARSDQTAEAIAQLQALAQRFARRPEGRAALRRALAMQINLAGRGAADGPAWKQAEAIAASYAARYPDDRWAVLAVGDIAYEQGRHEKAIAQYRQVEATHPLYGPAQVRMAQALYAHSRRAVDPAKGKAANLEIQAALERGIAWCRKKIAEDAKPEEQAMVLRAIEAGEVVRCAALCDLAQDHAAVLKRYLAFAAEHRESPGIDTVERCLITALLGEQKPDEAVARFRRYQSRRPKSESIPPILRLLEDSLLKAELAARQDGDTERADRLRPVGLEIALERMALETDPAAGDAVRLARRLREAGRHRLAVTLLTEQLGRHPEETMREPLRFELASAYAVDRDPARRDKAIVLLKEMRRDYGDKPYLGDALGRALIEQQEQAEKAEPKTIDQAMILIAQALPAYKPLSDRWCTLQWYQVRGALAAGRPERAVERVKRLAFVSADFSLGAWTDEQKQAFLKLLPKESR